jgi:hypothetical protein
VAQGGVEDQAGPGGGGNYTSEPTWACGTAVSLLQVAGFAPLYLQMAYPTPEMADTTSSIELPGFADRDANDHLSTSASTITILRPLSSRLAPMTGQFEWRFHQTWDYESPKSWGAAQCPPCWLRPSPKHASWNPHMGEILEGYLVDLLKRSRLADRV